MGKKINFDAYVPKYSPNQQIPPSATLIKDPTDIETKSYMISFFNYKESLCQIKELNPSSARKLLRIFRDVGNKCTSRTDLKNKSGLNMKPVKNSGEYSKLFKGLSEDVSLYEHYLSKNARLFYFEAPLKLFEVVAIRNTHYRIDKSS